MNVRLSELPVFLVDSLGSALVIVLALTAAWYARKLLCKEPRELLWSYLYMVILALTAFSIGRGVGHLVRNILIITGHKDIWLSISPLSGAINTLTFVIIAAITIYYNFVESAFLLLRQAHAKLRDAFEEIRRNRDQIILLERHAITDKMAATLAHETRNPIFTIANFAKLLLRKYEKDDFVASHLEIIVAESQKLEGLIDGILKVKHDLPHLMKRVSVKDLLNELNKIGMNKTESSEVTVCVTPSSEEKWLHVDIRSLLAGLTEIILNAIEASPKGGTVDIAAESEEEQVIIRISDAGSGIPPDVLPKVTEPGFSTKKFSAGLGLTFAREILEANHGLLKIESVLSKGTTVTVAFPVETDEPMDIRSIQNAADS